MKRLVVASLMALAASVLVSDTASAQQGFGYSGIPFYPAYGARFVTVPQTPPYFAANPPVYYGSRYARPYGISPFPAPPVVNAPAGYTGQPAAQFYRPPAEVTAPVCNPYITGKRTASPKPSTPKLVTLGKIQTNPFVQPSERLAKN